MKDPRVQEACTKVGHIVADLINPHPNGAEKVSASMAVSVAALAVTACSVMDGFDPDQGNLPNADHLLFAALLVWAGCHLDDKCQISVEFSPEMITDTMDHFKKFTGQDARPLLNKGMMAAFDRKTKVDRSQFGQNARFLPH